ncbi:MAG TPA: hypothetical protein VG123_00275, partial [Streptosporangiaceae bacterium]|nr:hypothetical protein [Streptosporangiaceae bacterium]
IVAFWSAYVVTRPLGASLADWVSVPHWRGGLGFGWGTVSVVLTLIIIGFVGYLAISGKDIAPAAAPMEPGPVPPRRGSGQPYAGQPRQVPEYFSAPTAYPHSPPPQPGLARQPAGAWERAGTPEPTGDWQPAGPWQACRNPAAPGSRVMVRGPAGLWGPAALGGTAACRYLAKAGDPAALPGGAADRWSAAIRRPAQPGPAAGPAGPARPRRAAPRAPLLITTSGAGPVASRMVNFR